MKALTLCNCLANIHDNIHFNFTIIILFTFLRQSYILYAVKMIIMTYRSFTTPLNYQFA